MSFLVYGVIYSFPQIWKTFGRYFLKIFVCLFFPFPSSPFSTMVTWLCSYFKYSFSFFILDGFLFLVLISFLFEGIKLSAVINLLLILTNEMFISHILFLPLALPSASLYILFFSFKKLFSWFLLDSCVYYVYNSCFKILFYYLCHFWVCFYWLIFLLSLSCIFFCFLICTVILLKLNVLIAHCKCCMVEFAFYCFFKAHWKFF